MAATCVVFVVLARDPPAARRVRPAPGMLASFAMFRHSRRAWALVLFYALAFGGFVSMFVFLPTLLVDVHDLSRSAAGTRAAVFALVVVAGRPIGGWLADRIGAVSVLRAAFAVVVAADVVLAAAYTSMVPLTVACLTMAGALGVSTGAVFKLVPVWFAHRVGAVTGAVGAAGGLGGFFPPLVMGLVKSLTGGYALGFALMAVVAAACVVVVAAAREPRT
jgi:NNP family nitrate/nitrite transporter-like MFS transporter